MFELMSCPNNLQAVYVLEIQKSTLIYFLSFSFFDSKNENKSKIR